MLRALRFASTLGGARSFSSGAGGGGKPPHRPFVAPIGAHYVSGVKFAPTLKELLALGKKRGSYAVWRRHVYLHVLNHGGEVEIMKDGLMGVQGRYTGANVRAHTVEDSEIEGVDRRLPPGGSEYYFITGVKPVQDHDGTMTGVEWSVPYLQTIAWLLRLQDGSFFVGGELARDMDKSGGDSSKK